MIFFRKPVPTFRDHALVSRRRGAIARGRRGSRLGQYGAPSAVLRSTGRARRRSNIRLRTIRNDTAASAQRADRLRQSHRRKPADARRCARGIGFNDLDMILLARRFEEIQRQLCAPQLERCALLDRVDLEPQASEQWQLALGCCQLDISSRRALLRSEPTKIIEPGLALARAL